VSKIGDNVGRVVGQMEERVAKVEEIEWGRVRMGLEQI
jgi:hypothetical protein